MALGTLLAWAPPIFALSSLLFLVQFYFLKFATDVLLLPPLAVGLIFASGRFWDAVSDPIVGTWSDRTRTRLGRRRPWLLAGIPLLMLSLVMIWIPPHFSQAALLAWTALALFLFYTAFTMYGVPHLALGTELSTDHHDRSRIFGAQGAAFTFGMILAFAGMQYIISAEDSRAAAARLILGAMAVMPLVLLVPPLLLRERPEHQGRGASSSWSAIRDVLRNPHARLLLLAQFVQMGGAGVLGIMAPYLTQYVMKRPDLTGSVPAIYILCNLASIPLWVRLSRRYGKRNVWLVGMVGTAVSFGSTAFVGEGDVALISVLLVFAGAFGGCGTVVGPSILADVIDSDEHLTGERKEGAYAAAWGFAVKSANTLVILLVSAALQFSDFTPNVEQTQGTLLMLRGINGGMPFAMFLLGALLFRRFSLNEREHAVIRADLDRRNAA